MRSIEYYIILTADGMYADPDGGLGHYDPAEDEHRYANELLRKAGVEIMGRRMYDVMTYWDELDLHDPAEPDVGTEFARLWRETPKLVVSRGDPELGPNATRLEGDVVEAVRALKATDGPPIAIGAGRTSSRRSPRPGSSTATAGWSSRRRSAGARRCSAR